MKMITKVFLVIAILLICLIVWVLFLGGDGIIQGAWNGIAGQVNETWEAITGADAIVPLWEDASQDNVGDAIGELP